MRSYFFALVFAFVLSGCSSTPTLPEAALGTPDHRIFRKDLVKQKDTGQEVQFVRDHGAGTAGPEAVLDIDREPIAALAKGEKLTIWLSPGTYKFGASPGFSDYSPKMRTEVEMDIKAGRKYLVRVGGGIQLKLEPRNF